MFVIDTSSNFDMTLNVKTNIVFPFQVVVTFIVVVLVILIIYMIILSILSLWKPRELSVRSDVVSSV